MTFSSHVDAIIEKARPAVHAIIQLKKIGVSSNSLAIFYQSRNLSIIAYAAPSWFPYLSNTDKEKLEWLWRLCLRALLPDIDNYDQNSQLLI